MLYILFPLTKLVQFLNISIEYLFDVPDVVNPVVVTLKYSSFVTDGVAVALLRFVGASYASPVFLNLTIKLLSDAVIFAPPFVFFTIIFYMLFWFFFNIILKM